MDASQLNLHDLLATMPMNLFQDAEINPATQQYEMIITDADLQQALTPAGLTGESLVLTGQDLYLLLNDVEI